MYHVTIAGARCLFETVVGHGCVSRVSKRQRDPAIVASYKIITLGTS